MGSIRLNRVSSRSCLVVCQCGAWLILTLTWGHSLRVESLEVLGVAQTLSKLVLRGGIYSIERLLNWLSIIQIVFRFFLFSIHRITSFDWHLILRRRMWLLRNMLDNWKLYWCIYLTLKKLFLDGFQAFSLNHHVHPCNFLSISHIYICQTFLNLCLYFKIIEGYHHSCNIIKSFCIDALVKNLVNCQSRLLMNWDSLSIIWSQVLRFNIPSNDFIILHITSWSIPSCIYNLFVIKLFKNSITAKKNEIVVFFYFEAFDIRCANDTSWIASVSRILGFNVTKSSWDGKSSRKDSVRANNHLNSWGIVRWWIRHITLILINLTSILFDSFLFSLIFWLMILRKQKNFLSAVNWHNGSAISNISNIAYIRDYKNNNGTSSTSFNKVFLRTTLLMSPFKKYSLCFHYPVLNGLFWIFWEIFISNNKLMKLVTKIVCTSSASMAIVYGKEWASWPLLYLLEFGLDYVQDNWYSIFIIISYNALMSIRSITAHNSILFTCKLGWMIRSHESINLLLFHLHVFLLLLSGHNEPSVRYKLVLTLWLAHGSLILTSHLIWTRLFNSLVIWTRRRLWMTILLGIPSRGFRMGLLAWGALIWFVSHSRWSTESVDARWLLRRLRGTTSIIRRKLWITIVFVKLILLSQ